MDIEGINSYENTIYENKTSFNERYNFLRVSLIHFLLLIHLGLHRRQKCQETEDK